MVADLLRSHPAGGAPGAGIDPTRYGLTDHRAYILPDSITPLIVAAGAAANTYGAWKQLTPALGLTSWVLAIILHLQNPGKTFEVEFAYGIPGFEATQWAGAIDAMVGFSGQTILYPLPFALSIPFDLAQHFRCRSNSGGGSIQVWTQYKF